MIRTVVHDPTSSPIISTVLLPLELFQQTLVGPTPPHSSTAVKSVHIPENQATADLVHVHMPQWPCHGSSAGCTRDPKESMQCGRAY